MLKYTIIDYTSNPAGDSTVIPEPIGWDEISPRLKRDDTWHGFFDFWDDSLQSLQFWDNARDILKNAYDTNGAEAKVGLLIEYKCDPYDDYDTLYIGKFQFLKYKFHCGHRCYVTCGIENTGCLMQFRNRYDQKVDLDSLKSFDSNSDNLNTYNFLNKEITLPTKKILHRNDWEINEGSEINYTDAVLASEVIGTLGSFFFTFPWNIDNITEIDISDRSDIILGYNQTTNPSPLFDFRDAYSGIVNSLPEILQCALEVNVAIELHGTSSITSADTLSGSGSIVLYYGSDENGWTTVPLQTGLFGPSETINISYSDTITLNPGDRIYVYFVIANMTYLTGGGGGGPSDPFDFNITFDSDCSIGIDVISSCAGTPAKVYLVNEVLSRITESYTNDCLRVFSDYFGRVDAQPYPATGGYVALDGCAGLEAITSGLKIRVKEADKIRIGDYDFVAKLQLSMNEMFDALNAIHNIGMGIESDPNRAGYSLLRVEPFSYFYQNQVLLTCNLIPSVDRELVPSMLTSIFKTGYDKWETESINGLNDVFGTREYRTTLSNTRNTLDRVCRFLASDYAIEITRRQYGSTTKDWRYDNDTFIVCLWRKICLQMQFNASNNITVFGSTSGMFNPGDTITITGTAGNDGTYTINTVSGGFLLRSITVVETVVDEALVTACIVNETTNEFLGVEQGNIDTATNILFPETCYNLRITPARNAIRHLKTIFQSYADPVNGKIAIAGAEGNSFAEIDLNDDDCVLEDGTLGESQEIDPSNLVDGDIAMPVYRPERVRFEYPITYAQYLTIKANPYGLIGYACGNNVVEYGWIEDFKYNLKTGLSEFVLRPKFVTG